MKRWSSRTPASPHKQPHGCGQVDTQSHIGVGSIRSLNNGRCWMRSTRSALAALFIVAMLAFGACTGQTSTPPAGSGPAINVLGTENFYADLLTQIGGSRVRATSLLNEPTADPHEYEASPKAAAAVADAKLVIMNGIGYDDFMDKLLSASPKSGRAVINVQELLGLKDDVNAHIWYDPATMPKVADAVVAELSKLDPQNSAYFNSQKAAYLAKLDPVNEKI